MIQIIVDVTVYGIFILELCTGFAYVGWMGDNGLVNRATQRGPYWFAMILHAAALLIYSASA